MHVTHLSLVDFRSYATADLALGPGVTALVGPNGQGKTNLVEALGYVATLSSHRVSSDAPLVRQGAARAVIRTAIARAGRSALVELEINPGTANRARINRAPVPRARDVLGMLRTVLFAPEDLALVKGDPDGRRRFLDDLLVARAPRFAGVRSDYDRVLRQRNALLKSAGATIKAGRGDVRTLDVWDAHLAAAGSALLAARLSLVGRLAPLAQRAYAAVSQDDGQASLVYRSGLGDDVTAGGDPGPSDEPFDATLLEARLLEAMAHNRPAELERGVSLVGPHRDDLLLGLGSLPARGYASHGECWSLAVALRLASYDLLRADPGEPGEGEPVLVLDDVFAELDTDRRSRLAALAAGAEQVLVTAAVAEDVPEALEGARVDVMAGEVRRIRWAPDAEPGGPDAAAAALNRARSAARSRGLNPGSPARVTPGAPSAARRRQPDASRSGAGPDARDPQLLGADVDRLVADRGWQAPVAVGGVIGRWESVVGADIAVHCTPEAFTDGVLVVRTDSTAWATQIRLLVPSLLRRLAEEVGEGTVEKVVVRGPTAPSWRRGPRVAPGSKGPRDTYG